MNNKHFELVLILFLLLYPVGVYCIGIHDLSFLATSVLFALPAASAVLCISNRAAFAIVMGVLSIASLVELVMVLTFGSFLLSGNIIAIATTTAEESSSFAETFMWTLWYFIPVLIAYAALLMVKKKGKEVRSWFPLCSLLGSVLLCVGFVCFKQMYFYESKLTNRYYIEKRILNRPPYNIFYQSINAVQQVKMKKSIGTLDSFDFGATRSDDVVEKEIYVLGIGESMRYDNLSLNGKYSRATTPSLSQRENLVLYDDYYSGACLTMYSVPQIMTRATAQNYALNYSEGNVTMPYKEVGFKTFGIVCSNLLSYETYLTTGVDSLFVVEADQRIPELVDSLSNEYSKTFFVLEFLGNHSYYYNYPPEMDVYHPNVNSDPDVQSDSLYINAYDNTILYQDKILDEILGCLDKPDVVSSFMFVSDHGEHITATGGGHGGDCAPKVEEYHVPLIFWHSDLYGERYPEKVENAFSNKAQPVNSDNVFYSVCDMAGITLPHPYSDLTYSIFSPDFEVHPRYVLVPDGKNYIAVD